MITTTTIITATTTSMHGMNAASVTITVTSC